MGAEEYLAQIEEVSKTVIDKLSGLKKVIVTSKYQS